MAKLLHIFYHKEGTFSLLCQQVQLFTHSTASTTTPRLYTDYTFPNSTTDYSSVIGFLSSFFFIN